MKPVKALILGFLLLVPILVFIFISVFGTHHFSLNTFYPKMDDAGKVVYNAAGDTVFQTVPFFSLTGQEGQKVTQADLAERITVVSFFALPCADSCQRVFSQLVRVQEAYENNPQINLVSFGIAAPEQNQAVAELAREFGVQKEKWFLLTGDSSTLAAFAAEGYHEPFQKQGDRIEASTKLVLVDKEKKIRGVYDGTDAEEVDRLVLEINVLLDEYSKRK
ncbi:SCO family protein [Pontibacter mangrovi]|nr:SCO family protein [Pontibacter mangrovi]